MAHTRAQPHYNYVQSSVQYISIQGDDNTGGSLPSDSVVLELAEIRVIRCEIKC